MLEVPRCEATFLPGLRLSWPQRDPKTAAGGGVTPFLHASALPVEAAD